MLVPQSRLVMKGQHLDDTCIFFSLNFIRLNTSRIQFHYFGITVGYFLRSDFVYDLVEHLKPTPGANSKSAKRRPTVSSQFRVRSWCMKQTCSHYVLTAT